MVGCRLSVPCPALALVPLTFLVCRRCYLFIFRRISFLVCCYCTLVLRTLYRIYYRPLSDSVYVLELGAEREGVSWCID